MIKLIALAVGVLFLILYPIIQKASAKRKLYRREVELSSRLRQHVQEALHDQERTRQERVWRGAGQVESRLNEVRRRRREWLRENGLLNRDYVNRNRNPCAEVPSPNQAPVEEFLTEKDFQV